MPECIGKFISSCSDLGALKEFYSKVFPAWTFAGSGSIVAITPEGGGGDPGGIVWVPGQEVDGWVPCVLVEDINTKITKWKNEGGTVVVPKTTIRGYGAYAVLRDPLGGIMGLWTDA